jgi:hypothetical protein
MLRATAQPLRGLRGPAPRRAFASEKELKKRMSAVKTIIKITKSTKMIAAAKFKAAETAVFPAREIVVSCDGMAELSMVDSHCELLEAGAEEGESALCRLEQPH